MVERIVSALEQALLNLREESANETESSQAK